MEGPDTIVQNTEELRVDENTVCEESDQKPCVENSTEGEGSPASVSEAVPTLKADGLEIELQKAKEVIISRDEELGKLKALQDKMEDEVRDLTASLFEVSSAVLYPEKCDETLQKVFLFRKQIEWYSVRWRNKALQNVSQENSS